MAIKKGSTLPIGSMYGIVTYDWLKCMVNVGKYTSPMDPMGYTYRRPPLVGSIWHPMTSYFTKPRCTSRSSCRAKGLVAFSAKEGRNTNPAAVKSSPPKHKEPTCQKLSSWWFQPIWTIWVKLDHFPKVWSEHRKYSKPPSSCWRFKNY